MQRYSCGCVDIWNTKSVRRIDNGAGNFVEVIPPDNMCVCVLNILVSTCTVLGM